MVREINDRVVIILDFILYVFEFEALNSPSLKYFDITMPREKNISMRVSFVRVP